MTTETHDDSHDPSVSSRRRRPRLPRAIWALVVARTANRLGAFTLAFLAVVLVDDLGASLAQAGLVVSLFGLATIPSRLLGGVLADRLGRVPTIVLGLVGCAVTQLALAVSPTLLVASAAAVGLGLVFELYEPPSQALVADLTDDAERPRAYGLLAAALAAAGAGAGLLATWIGGVDLRWLLVADAASCLAATALVLAVVRPALADATTSGKVVASAADVADVADVADAAETRSPWRDRRLLAMLASGTVFAVVYMALVTALPLTLVARGIPAAQTGLVLTVSAVTVVAGQPLLRIPLLSNAFRAMTIGLVILAAGLTVTAFVTTLPGFALAAVLWSVGDLLLLGHPWTVVSRLAPAGSRGGYLAAYGLSWGVATTVAPVLGTQLLTHGGPTLLWVVLAATTLALASAQPALGRCCARPLTPRRADRDRRARRAARA